MIQVKVRNRYDGRPLQLYYVDPITGRRRTRSSGTRDKRQAERAAAKWEAELINGKASLATSWEVFRVRFVDESLAAKAKRTGDSYKTALNYFERIIGKPRQIGAIDASTMSLFQAKLRAEGLEETTIANALRHLKASFRWAEKMGLMGSAPKIMMPATPKRRLSRGRPISGREAVSMMQTASELYGDAHAGSWRFLFKGLWFSGLRLGEAMKLSWTDEPVLLDLYGGRFPRIIWFAEGQKSRRDEITPITPDFFRLVSSVPVSEREGPVFKVTHPVRTVTRDVAGRAISDVGAQAMIKTAKNKFASAHDFRRSFGQRWAPKLMPLQLKKLMRHSSLETTLKFYVDLDSDDVAKELWGNGTPDGT